VLFRSRVVATLALAAGLTGCGGGATPVWATGVDATLAAKVPAAIRAAGVITIGTDATYAPNEFLDGPTVVGFDVDLFTVVAGRLGLKTQWRPAKFDDIIPGVLAGTYHVGVSSFTITNARLKRVTMVSYFYAGTQWADRAGGNFDPDNACGRTVGVEAGTVQVDDLAARARRCTSGGLKTITVHKYQAQSDATAALTAGRDDAMLADSPVCAYAVKQSDGALELLGRIYDGTPYGYVLPKDQTGFGAAIAATLKGMMADGTYQKILDRWGVTAGAITAPGVNPRVT